MAKISPTQLSLRHLRADGRFTEIQVVETWVQFPPPGRRRDLYNIIDILAIGPGITMAVQATSAGGVSARKMKLTEAEATRHVLEAGWLVEIHGWAKLKNRWVLDKTFKFQLEQPEEST